MLPTNLRFCQRSYSAGAATSRRAASLSCRLTTIFPSHQLCPTISALFRRPGVTAAPCTLYTRLRDRYFIFGGSLMDSTVPADLLKLRTQLEAWRATRRYARQPIPNEFRQAAADMAGRYSPSLVRRILKLDPWQLNKRTTKKPDRARHKPKTAFFTLPSEPPLLLHGSSATQDLTGCRLQIERPDGARLILTLPSLNLASVNQLCTDFLRL